MTTDSVLTQFIDLAIDLTAFTIRHHLADGHTVPLILLMGPTGKFDMIAVAEGHPANALTPILATHQYAGWATITDAWISKQKTGTDLRDAMRRYGRVKDMPDRGEAIVCAGKYAPTNYEFSLTQQYTRTPSGLVLAGEVVVITNTHGEGIDSPWAFGERAH